MPWETEFGLDVFQAVGLFILYTFLLILLKILKGIMFNFPPKNTSLLCLDGERIFKKQI